MIKLDIVNLVADKTGVPKQKAEQVVDSLFNAMKDALALGKRIELRGFGVFVVKPRKRGVGRNPEREVTIPLRGGRGLSVAHASRIVLSAFVHLSGGVMSRALSDS